MSNADKIQMVINTIEKLSMPSTIDNINRLIGIYQNLLQIRDELAKQEEVTEDAGKADTK